MPPKAKLVQLRESRLCNGRDTTPLQQYVGQMAPKGYLASVLQREGVLEYFRVDPVSTECGFTFAGSDWFGVAVKGQGEPDYWFDDLGNKKQGTIYFKLKLSPDGTQIGIDQSTVTFDKPAELTGLKPCAVGASGRCGQVEPPKAEKAPRAAKPKADKPNAGGAGAPGSGVGEDTAPLTDAELEMVERIQISAPTGSVSGDRPVKITNEELAKMDKLKIIAWMVENMKPDDLMSCLRSGALSAQDKAALLDLEAQRASAVRPSEAPPSGITREEAGAARAVMDLPGEQSVAMLKSLTKDQIIKNLRAIKSENDRQKAVVDLCRRFNINSTVNARTKKISFFDIDKNAYSLDDALDFCAGREAVRLKYELERVARETQTRGKVQGYVGGVRQRLAQRKLAPAPPAAGGSKSLEQLTAEINSISDPAEKVKRLKQIFSSIPGYEKVKPNRSGTIMVYIGDDVNDWETALEIYFSGGGGAPEAAPVRKPPEQIIAEVNSLSGEGKVQMLTDLFKNIEGFVKVGLNKRTNKVMVYIDDDVDDWEPLIRLYAGQLSGFGRRRRCKIMPKRSKRPYTTRKVRSNFKCAAKKCKGTRNYRKCMKTELRKIYGKKRTSRFGAKRCKVVPKRSKRPYTTSKVRSNFKCAVKKCKGTSNYRKCMKTELRRIYRKKRGSCFGKKKKTSSQQIGLFKIAAKTCKGRGKGYRKCFRATLKKLSRKTPKGRKSPKQSATLFKVGTVRKGMDGNRWVVKKTVVGVKRWVKK
jgi:hypothetical protein